jgi:hypothetical protein
MLIRAFAVCAAVTLSLATAAAATASGTVVVTKTGGKPQSYAGARLVLKGQALTVTLADGRALVFGQNSCQNTTEIMQCQPIGVSLKTKSGAHDVDFTDGLGYFNLTKRPQPIGTQPPQTLPRNGLYITLEAADGTSVTIRGTLDVGSLTAG